ncbi:HD domain-containing protein [Burkholderia gladioli]|uniref:HD domain-containing protein n=1 Tax=Burkholderia gladioli TaxID=28095 RepID=UPI00163E8ECF|nr:hypothetical protein [Burkholderia gladioli]
MIDDATLDVLREECAACFGTAAVWPLVEQAYREPQRHYHTLAHLAELFEQLAPYRDAPHRLAIELAVWAHDIVYATTLADYADNEARSASWLAATAAALCAPAWQREHADALRFACELVLATKSHRLPASALADPSRRQAAALFLDADLAILAATPERLLAYDREIALEWGQTPAAPSAPFRDGRLRALMQLRSQTPLFLSDEFAPLTTVAHVNLDRLIRLYSPRPGD